MLVRGLRGLPLAVSPVMLVTGRIAGGRWLLDGSRLVVSVPVDLLRRGRREVVIVLVVLRSGIRLRRRRRRLLDRLVVAPVVLAVLRAFVVPVALVVLWRFLVLWSFPVSLVFVVVVALLLRGGSGLRSGLRILGDARSGQDRGDRRRENERADHAGTSSVSRTATVCIIPACMW
jgi:hypothetical protein